MTEKNKSAESLPPKGKLVAAGIIFVAGFLSPLLIPVVTSSNFQVNEQHGNNYE